MIWWVYLFGWLMGALPFAFMMVAWRQRALRAEGMLRETRDSAKHEVS